MWCDGSGYPEGQTLPCDKGMLEVCSSLDGGSGSMVTPKRRCVGTGVKTRALGKRPLCGTRQHRKEHAARSKVASSSGSRIRIVEQDVEPTSPRLPATEQEKCRGDSWGKYSLKEPPASGWLFSQSHCGAGPQRVVTANRSLGGGTWFRARAVVGSPRAEILELRLGAAEANR